MEVLRSLKRIQLQWMLQKVSAKDWPEMLFRPDSTDNTVETKTPLTSDGSLTLYTWNNPEGKKAFWHSSAHLLAQAILSFHPEAKLTIGPAIESGFYYDVDFGDETISENDFKKIEDKMLDFATSKIRIRNA